MKKIIIVAFLGLICLGGKAQIQSQVPIKIQIATSRSDTEKIKIPFPQPATLHDDGGWEKGPSNWQTSSKFPVSYRSGLLFLDRKKNGLIKYFMVEIRFNKAGAIDLTANSTATSKSGKNTWKTVFGKDNEVLKQTIICTESDFGTEMYLYLKNYRPYRRTQVN
ncbi:hypothetical protein ASE74_18070 [Pedobacter sp. Leaf216]|uniref:hypothetical protein n=1 Tax=Pedobacter sp. Leaf216 TaxID=1735684 RepID=UPI0006F438A8|nr:hypothetical protein [Pedobacter sp. Leaf216]KQM77165.1 hypothetical protein ASE74_18070 [Pedobacter sp. Leaf216]